MTTKWPFEPVREVLVVRLGGEPVPPPGLARKPTPAEQIEQRWAADGAGATAANMGRYLGVTSACIYAWARKGLVDKTAERVALELGIEPVMLWPDWYDTALAGEEAA